MDGTPLEAGTGLADRLRAVGIGLRLSPDFVAVTPRIAQLAARPDEPEARRSRGASAKADALERARRAKSAWVAARTAGGSRTEWIAASRVRVDGREVWLAYARERPRRGWYLGVPVSVTGDVVLLCEDLGGDVHALVVAHDQLTVWGPAWPVSRGRWLVSVVRGERGCPAVRAGEQVESMRAEPFAD